MPRHFVILGAGIAGLATGWFIKQQLKADDQLTILEQSDHTGGWIQTLQINDFLFEQGPRSCRTKGGVETLALIESLHLEQEIITPHQDSRHRYLFYNDQLQKFPSHPWQIPFHPLTKGWAKALWNDFTRPKRKQEDESIADFFTRRLNSAWVDKLIDPFILGIYAGDCQRLSLKSCFPVLDEWEQKKGSLLKGALSKSQNLHSSSAFIQSMQEHPLYSFKNGMSTLPKALEKRLKKHLHLNSEIQSFEPNTQGFKISINSEQIIQASHLISTVPIVGLKKYFPQFSQEFDWLKYASVNVMNIGFDQIDAPLNGFGYLIPSSVNTPVMGCVWDSSIFPQHNVHPDQARLTMMLGGIKYSEVEQFDDEKLIDISLKALDQQCGIKRSPKIIQIKRAIQAIPQYEVGYEKWKTSITSKINKISPTFFLSGSAFTGVSINDCIKQARRLAQQLALL
ncbi:MAG: protoporphyrinogen oxidase [Parachlamydiaceae bacterium]|nr:protoporphyrinogen oxidase [Parachlamydiaceae bacterium]